MNQDDKIKEFQKKIDDLIEERPELAIYQEELQKKLKGITDSKDRLGIIMTMIKNNLLEIQKLFKQIENNTKILGGKE
jgi:hypothetical protein